jgi:hypothetical protein
MNASLRNFCFAAIGVIASGNVATAATYSIDPASSLTLSGNLNVAITAAIPNSPVVTGSGNFAEQSPGSLHTTLSGFINANAAGGILSFPGGSSITALPSGTYDPQPSPAAFGFQLTIPLTSTSVADVGTLRLFGDIRDLAFDVSGNAPLTGNTFDPGGLSLISKSGTVDLHGFFCNPGETNLTNCNDFGTTTSPLDDGNGPDLLPSGTASFTGQTLSVPLTISAPGDETNQQTITIGGIPVQVTTRLTGNFKIDGNVFAAVPEPAAWIALCLGLLSFAAIARRAKT